jgi:hypothetical protein
MSLFQLQIDPESSIPQGAPVLYPLKVPYKFNQELELQNVEIQTFHTEYER